MIRIMIKCFGNTKHSGSGGGVPGGVQSTGAQKIGAPPDAYPDLQVDVCGTLGAESLDLWPE